MFFNDGGGGVGSCTENARPWAWLKLWYGSWPKTRTLTLSTGVSLVQEYTFSLGGKMVWFFHSVCRYRLRLRKYGLVSSWWISESHETSIDSISRRRRSFWSGVNESIHFCLSNVLVVTVCRVICFSTKASFLVSFFSEIASLVTADDW